MRPRPSCLLLGALLSAAFGSPARAGIGAETELVRCGDESCLKVSGYRDEPDWIVSVNGREVTADGAYNWRVHLRLETVREMSAPGARTIEVSLRDPETNRETSANARLPIGLLGDITTLASLEVTAF